MPMKPRGREWDVLSLRVKEEQGWKCKFSDAPQGLANPITGSIVVLTTAHLDHDDTNNARANLAALCQRCHLRHDLKQHMANARATRRRKKRNHELELEVT
jgi:5-methylcytosine-specific restriction endonuclease McrA